MVSADIAAAQGRNSLRQMVNISAAQTEIRNRMIGSGAAPSYLIFLLFFILPYLK